MTTKEILLVTLPGFTEQQQRILERLRNEGRRFSILTDQDFEVSEPVFEQVFRCKFNDLDSARAAIPQGYHPDVIATDWCDRTTLIAAALNWQYRLRGIPPEVAYRCRSKLHMRQVLQRAGIPVPKFRVCKTFAEIREAVVEFGGPCVAKPVGGDSSLGAFGVRSADEVDGFEATYNEALMVLADEGCTTFVPRTEAERALFQIDEQPTEFMRDYIVEEFLEGQPYSIDSIVQDGVASIMCIAEQRRLCFPVFVQTAERIPALVSDATMAALQQLNQAVITAFGIDRSATHLEVIVGPKGPRVVEIGARFGGDNIHDAVVQYRGISLLEEVIRVLEGEHRTYPPFPGLSGNAHVAMEYLRPSKRGTFQGLEISDKVRSDPQITELWCSQKSGTLVKPPPEGYEFCGYVQVKDATPEGADARLSDALRHIQQIIE
jgi:biotin carboxylase